MDAPKLIPTIASILAAGAAGYSGVTSHQASNLTEEMIASSFARQGKAMRAGFDLCMSMGNVLAERAGVAPEAVVPRIPKSLHAIEAAEAAGAEPQQAEAPERHPEIELQ